MLDGDWSSDVCSSDLKALVGSVKSLDDMTIREVEDGLVRGTLPPLKARQAKALLSGGYKAAFLERDAEGDEDIVAALRRNLSILSK
jgi:hypothetical protein